MRFNNLIASFPQPVLRPADFESSYLNSDFKFDLELEVHTTPHKLNISCEILHDDIVQLIQQNKAKLALAVHCKDTYLYEIKTLSLKKQQQITLSENDVFGNVYFTLVVIATKDISGFSPDHLEPAFAGLSFDIRKGDVLAVSDEVQKFYSIPPIRLNEGIFQLKLQPDLHEDAFEISLEEQKIHIGVGASLNNKIQQNMASKSGQLKNISSIYFPALIDVLYQAKAENYEGKAWFEAIAGAMKSHGTDINTDPWDPLQEAQKLLQSPYMTLLDMEAA